MLAIISVLMAFLFPVVQKARLQAKSAQCLSNLRSFGIAEASYAADWRGTIMGNGLAPAWTRQPAFLKYFWAKMSVAIWLHCLGTSTLSIWKTISPLVSFINEVR